MIKSKTFVASFRSVVWPSLLMMLVLVSASPVLAQLSPDDRPPTQDLLPETTVSFIQVDNFRDLIGKLRETSFAQMFQDPSIASLQEGLLEEARTAYEEARGDFGPDVDDLVDLPAGELTFAVIAPRRRDPEYMLVFELEEETEAVDRLLDSGRAYIENETDEKITSDEESEDGIEYESFQVDSKRIKFFRKGKLLVGSTSESELDAFVDRWAGREVEKVRPLSKNRKFITVMNRCRGNNELKPEARFFVDPIALAKSSYRGNVSAQVALNFLPSLGLDGLLGIGGSMLLTEDDFESVIHMHVLLADPRTGIFEMTALKPTEYEPEPWLPADAVSCMTTSWNIDRMMGEFTEMVEAIQGEEGVVDQWIEKNINEVMELDLKEDILAHLSGRITYCQWTEQPIKLNSQVNVIALEVDNIEEFEKSLEAVIDRVNQGDGGEEGEEEKEAEVRIEVAEYNGIRIWSQPLEGIEERIEKRKKRFLRMRKRSAGDEEAQKSFTELSYDDLLVRQPSFALIGNYFVFSPQSKGFIEHAIDTQRGDSDPLFDDPKFRSISDKVTKLLKSELPSAMMYSNPEESFRMLFELVKSDSTQALINRMAKDNEKLSGFKGRWDENPLPEFDDIKRFLKPSGGCALSDQTGYHFLVFTLRDDQEE